MILSIHKINELKNSIEKSIESVYKNDLNLILNKGMEQSIVFRFAIYLYENVNKIEWMKNLYLDLEYNKNLLNTKKMPSRKNGVRPDLIIHNRGNNDSNILVVEIKGFWNKEDREKDVLKLREFTDQNGSYKYGLGVFIDLYEKQFKQIYISNNLTIYNNINTISEILI